MRYAVAGILGLCVLVLTFCLLMPLVDRKMSWEEAGLGIFPAAGLGLVASALFLRGVGAPPREATSLFRNRAVLFWSGALLWALLLGALVTVATTASYHDNRRRAFEEQRRGERFSLHAAYARYDEIGTWYGWSLLGLAGVSALGLGIAIVLHGRQSR